MVNWNEGSNHNPIDPRAVKFGAEQEDDRRLRPLDEAEFIARNVWAGICWPFRVVLRLDRRS